MRRVIIAFSRREWRIGIVRTLRLMSMGIALGALWGHFSELANMRSWGGPGQMSLPTTFAILFLAIASVSDAPNSPEA
jgi:hypothetical protein